MAVDAKHLNLFPQQQQVITNMHGFPYNNQMPTLPLPMPENFFCDSVNTDSGLTFNLPTITIDHVAASRKRSRDSFNNHFTACNNNNTSPVFSTPHKAQIPSSFDVMPVVQQYQLDINSIISHHTKKIRMELEEQQKQQARMLVSAIGERVMKKLNEKDEQIQRMGKLNLVLQERVKSLYVENQLWRDLAQTNEATANSLRNNLEQVLAHVSDDNVRASAGATAAVEEDVESCCGSSDHGAEGDEEEVRTLAAGEAQDNKSKSRMCKRCGERESCVLLLPCRHLCLCTVCGSTLVSTCPVCNSSMNATVHVNMSS